jgi:heptosyltransferase-2
MYQLRKKQQIPVDVFNFITSIFFHTTKATTPIDWAKVRNIAVINTIDVIGDNIILIPFFKILKQNTPQAKITYLTKPLVKEVLEAQGIIDEFVPLDYRDGFSINISKVKALQNKHYDVAIAPSGDVRDIFLMHFLNSTRKISHTRTGGSQFLTDAFSPDYTNPHAHIVDDKLYVLKKAGCRYVDNDKYPRLLLTETMKQDNEKFITEHNLENKKILGIHPGASGEVREWQYYGNLLAAILKQEPNLAIIIFCDKTCRDKAKQINEQIGKEAIIFSKSISNYLSLVSVCHKFISNDSGAAHIAAAYGLKTIDILTNNIPEWWGALNYKQQTIYISHKFSCKPCRCLKKCPKGTNECRDSITVEEVLEAYKKL